MEKPVSLSVKEWIIRNMSTRMNIPEKTIEAVVNHQFEGAHKALVDSYSLELAGFGKFYFNKKKAKFKMQKYLWQKKDWERISVDEKLTPQKRHNAGLKLISVTRDIELLKPKLDENTFEGLVRGMDQPPIPTSQTEENN